MTKILVIALGGAVGTVLRYLLSNGVYRIAGGTFPWGTMSVNLAGSFAIGFLWALFEAAVVSPAARGFALIGVLGGFTTFSSLTVETVNLFRDGEVKLGLYNLLFSNVLGIICVILGFMAFRGLQAIMK